MTEHAQGLVAIGKPILTFAGVHRATYREDGCTPESDTDHTVMLSVCACALAEKLYPSTLDRGLVAQFAIVHALVEAYASDTDSFGLTPEARRLKDAREHEAFERIEREFSGVYPWIPETIARYERLDTNEARFVKTLDKILPKVTHILNGAAVFRARNEDPETMRAFFDRQREELRETHAADMPELIEILGEMTDTVLAVLTRDGHPRLP